MPKVPMARPAITIFLLLTLNFVNMAQTPQTPNMEAQRTAMKKLDFLVGEWSGQASVTRGGVVIELEQSEVAQFKLDGLVLMVEGVGRTKSDGVRTRPVSAKETSGQPCNNAGPLCSQAD